MEIKVIVIALLAHLAYATIPLSDFYPFHEEDYGLVRRRDDGFAGPLKLMLPMQFYGEQYDEIYVNSNGVLSFKTGLPQWTPDPFPSSAIVVAPYWADVDLSRNNGKVYYYETHKPSILEKINREIRTTFIAHLNFEAKAAFVATWERVTFFGGTRESSTNTFQCILVTDREETFAIFLYNELSWTTGTASKGDPTSGLGGEAAQVGFNAGDGQNFLAVKGSGTISVLNVRDTSNVGVPGEWIFKVGKVDILPAGCTETGNRLYIYPPRVPLTGGEIIAQGPCFDAASGSVKCKIGNTYVDATMNSQLQALCRVPPQLNRGTVAVQIVNPLTGDGDVDPAALEIVCPPGFYGSHCENECHCAGGFPCDEDTGECDAGCSSGYTGRPYCDQQCQHGRWGPDCNYVCKCSDGGFCDGVSGKCSDGSCSLGWKGPNCEKLAVSCPLGTFGENCESICHCLDLRACNSLYGTCDREGHDTRCEPGWTGYNCQERCPAGFFGQDCANDCHCAGGASCHPESGKCPGDCAPGYIGIPYCQLTCPPGYKSKGGCLEPCDDGTFGMNCALHCHCLDEGPCDKVTGRCKNDECSAGYRGLSCQEKCEEGYFGINCATKCGACKNGAICDKLTGKCPAGCETGYTGIPFCLAECPDGSFGVDCIGTCHCERGAACDKVSGECPEYKCETGWGGSNCQAFSCVGRVQDRSYVDPFDCTHYYTCTRNPIRRCPRGQAFDDVAKVCNFRRSVNCTNDPRRRPACDDPNAAGAHRHNENCQKYYTCTQDPRQTCPPGELWNDDIQDCIFVYDVKCGTRKDREVIEHNRVALKFACEGMVDGYYSHPSYCTMYQQCHRKRGFLLPCPAGYYWENDIKKCVPPEEASCLKHIDDLFY